MRATDFTDNHRVVHLVDDLQANWVGAGRQISDIIDADGHQYVDLVMEGGGVLGIALVGYTYALESVGIRFLGLGGTSAGAINALVIAALAPPQEAKSTQLVELLANLDMFSFVDGDSDARDFVESLVDGAGIVKMSWKVMQILDNLSERLGLNPGNAFLDWLRDTIGAAGVRTTRDLTDRMRTVPPGLRTRAGTALSAADADAKLAVVVADISTETKVVFPRMARLYWENADFINPAHYVRASMSIPAFFYPYRVTGLPKDAAAVRRWKEEAGYEGPVPEEVLFVDGGVMSNFPIDLFHAPGVPQAPTLGVKIGTDRSEPHQIDKPLQLLGAVFDSARHYADYDFILRHPDYKHLLGSIDTGEHNWLNFRMANDARIDLFTRGVQTAHDFLLKFDWAAYKEIRRALATRQQ
jgi:NTE family protein